MKLTWNVAGAWRATAWSGLVAGWLLGNVLPVGAQVVLHPIDIYGTIAWNNPAGPVLTHLNAAGFTTGYIAANQTSGGPNTASKYFPPDSRPTTLYRLTVEGGTSSGIDYVVSPTMVTGANDIYYFAPANALGVVYPGPDIPLDFIECAGLIHVHFRSSSGTPVAVTSSTTIEAQISGFGMQAIGRPAWASTETDHTLIVRGGADFNLTVTAYVQSGSDPFLNQFSFHSVSNFTVHVPCDGETNLTMIVPDLSGPPAGSYGQIIGNVDMLTENEHWIDNTFTVMAAVDGPQANWRLSDVGVQPSGPCGSPASPFPGVLTCNSAGQFTLVNLLPSDFDPANPRPYSVYGTLVYGLGQCYQRFQTPALNGDSPNFRVTVPAGTTVNLGDTFVMSPGWIVGDLYLCCPDDPGTTNSPLRYVSRLSDIDTGPPDGIPDIPTWDYTSRIVAAGRNLLGTGATRTATGGSGMTLFPGGFLATGPDAGHFVGDYRLTLGGLDSETTRWDQRLLTLYFTHYSTPDYLHSQIYIRNQHYQDVEVVPTQTVTNHHRYGLSRVVVTFHSADPSTTLHSPRISGSGSFVGADFEGNAASFTTDIGFADGTPTSQATAAADAQVILCLPQGNYTLTPQLESVSGGSSTHNVLPNFSQYVSPCSSITSTPCLQVAVTNAPDCPTNRAVTIAGLVTGCTNIASITYRLNGGPLVTVCNNCGINPSFSFGITLADCANQLIVIATDVNGDVASVSQTLHYNVTPPVLSGCTNLVVAADPGTNGAVVSYLVTALDNCDGPVPVVYSPPPDSFFPVGTTLVTCTAWDHCLNTNTCTFTVTVTGGGTNCCDDCYPPYPLTINVPVVPGINYLANPLCHGTNNTLGVLLPNVPGGTMLKKWDRPTGTYSPEYSFDSGFGGWVDSNFNDASGVRLEPGEGFLLINPNGPFTNTWTGCLPDCPPPCLPTNGCVLVGRRGPGVALWSDLSSCPPICGTEVRIWNGTGFDNFTFDPLQGWQPYAPVVAEGHSAFVCLDTNTVCCTNNLVVNGSFELTSPALSPNSLDNALDPLTGVPGWTTSAGEFLEVWANTILGIPAARGVNQLEINAQSTDQTVSQTITNLSTNCPAEFCFQYTGRFGDVGNSPNNDFTVTLNGAFAMSVTLDPAAYATNGWLRFCTNFTPASSTLTISFHGHPHDPIDGGAHIDDVRLTQCCPTNPCVQPPVLICPTNKTVPCGTNWSFDAPVFDGGCCGTNVLVSILSTTTNGACPVYTRVWQATDCFSNSLTCTQMVTVVDTTPPMFTNCPPSLNLGCNPVSIPDCDPAVGATDNCSVATVTCARVDTTNGCAYTRTLTYTAIDSCGNSNTCVQVITWTVNAESHFFSTLAGSTVGSADGPGNTAQFFYPSGLAVDGAGVVYVADNNNHTIRKISSAGDVTTLAGLAGNPGIADGNGGAARFDFPTAVAVDGAGNVFVTDLVFSTIRKITPAGDVTTYAGSPGGFGSADGNGGAAQFYGPYGVAVDGAGYVYVADGGNHTIRKISPARDVTTLAGSAGNAGSTDGLNGLARFQNPQGLAVDGAGNLYVADTGNNTIRKITPAGDVTTLAGLAGNAGSADGPGNTARFDHPSGPAVDSAGNVYVADSHNHTIRKITPAGFVTTLAGAVGVIANVNGAAANARFAFPNGVAVDGAGNLYVVDNGNHSIRAGLKSASLVITCASNKTVECCASNATTLGSNYKYTVLKQFLVNGNDGETPRGGLHDGGDGFLYGLTYRGGNYQKGTVYKVGKNGSGFQVLHSFGATANDGEKPSGGLVEDANGTLFGCTDGGGASGAGTIFQTEKNGTGYLKLKSINPVAGDGRSPATGLIRGSDGVFYGTTRASWSDTGKGTVFKFEKVGPSYVYTVLHQFPDGAVTSGDGETPWASLLEARDGRLYGATQLGGSGGRGTIFTLNKDGSDYKVLVNLTGLAGDGARPYAALIEAASEDALYFTTRNGGGGERGTVCKLQRAGGIGDYTVLTRLKQFPAGISDGRQPFSPLVEGGDGRLYGTAYVGGSGGFGTVFRMNPDGTAYTVLKSFSNTGDGRSPFAGLIQDGSGVFYGTAEGNGGVVFKLEPEAPCGWTFDPPTATDDCCTNLPIIELSTVTNGLCPQVISRTWQVMDCCSNISTCTQTVTVVDHTPPVIVGCSNIFITIPHGQSSANVNFFVTATDSCSSPVTLTFTPPAGTFPVGLTPVTCVAEDACGNTSTCQFNVKVTEELDCPDLAVNVTATYPGPKLVHLVGTDTPCCGADFTYHIHYANNGVLPVSGATIQFKYPQSCSIVSIASPCIPPVTYSAFVPNLTRSCSGPFIPSSGLETFNLPTLNPGDRCTLSVKVHLCCDIMAPCGDQLPLKAQATILPLLPTDCKPGNNIATLSVRPCCSHDPNDCTVSPPGCGPEGFIHRDQALTYRVRFQNEGAGVAHEVGVVDILDEDLDLSTLEILDASHPFLLEQNGRELLWLFHNINLPSQNDDEDASQGFVTFRIRPFANAPVGTVIENSADVFFDANDPLTTVTTVNTITENPVPIAAFTVAPQPGSAGFVNDFQYTGGTPGAQCQWNFGPDATPQTATGLNPTGVVFATPGQHLVVLETSLGGCVAAPAVQLVTVGRPTLNLLQTATDASLSWAGDGYVVQETESLSPPIQWHTIVATPTFVGGWYQASVPFSTTGARFYRLADAP